jgi:hypothetical protein
MKNRGIKFVFTTLLLSSLAFADSPTDAPLMVTDANGNVVKQGYQDNQQDQASPRRKRSSKKDESVSAKTKADNSPKSDRQAEPMRPVTNADYSGNY